MLTWAVFRCAFYNIILVELKSALDRSVSEVTQPVKYAVSTLARNKTVDMTSTQPSSSCTCTMLPGPPPCFTSFPIYSPPEGSISGIISNDWSRSCPWAWMLCSIHLLATSACLILTINILPLSLPGLVSPEPPSSIDSIVPPSPVAPNPPFTPCSTDQRASTNTVIVRWEEGVGLSPLFTITELLKEQMTELLKKHISSVQNTAIVSLQGRPSPFSNMHCWVIKLYCTLLNWDFQCTSLLHRVHTPSILIHPQKQTTTTTRFWRDVLQIGSPFSTPVVNGAKKNLKHACIQYST